MAKNTPIQFALRKITTEQFAIIEDKFDDALKINCPFSFSFKINDKARIIAVSFKASFEQNANPFLICKVSCDFSVTADKWKEFYTEDTAKIVIPKLFMAHLGMITVGTTRGILHAKTENTNFNRFIVPLVNVVNTIKEDVVFDIPLS